VASANYVIQPIVSSASTPTATGGGGSAYDLSINGGAASTATTSVTLSLWGTGAYTMEVSDISTFIGAAWIPYTTSMLWTLASNPGTENVYVEYKAVSGSVVGSAQASIDLTTSSAATVPVPGSSPTAGMTASQIQSLLASLEAQLQTLEAEASSAAVTSSFSFTRNLSLGMTGNDVNQLQLFLISENVGPAARALKAHGSTKNFGALTKAALIEFQKSVGINPASGYFGPITRAYVNALP
jgi:hypothetical protein